MGITKLSKSGFKSSSYEKYNDFLAGNTAFNPSSYESIASVTVGSGGTSTITFSSIPSTYTHLQVRWISRNTSSGNNNFNMVINNNTTALTYTFHSLEANGTSAGAYGESNLRGEAIQVGMQATASNSSSIFGAGIIDILDYTNTNKYKTTRCFTGYDANGSGSFRLNSHLWNNTSAINRLDFSNTQGSFVEYTQVALYGIKGS